VRLPRVRFTVWRMIEAVAAAAILITAISWPPAALAIFGLYGAVIVHVVVLRSDHFQLGYVAGGFGIGAMIGIFFYYAVYPAAWVARYSVANSVVPSMVITLVLLGGHHTRQKRSQKRPRDKARLDASSEL
jgi:hypothetical protein